LWSELLSKIKGWVINIYRYTDGGGRINIDIGIDIDMDIDRQIDR